MFKFLKNIQDKKIAKLLEGAKSKLGTDEKIEFCVDGIIDTAIRDNATITSALLIATDCRIFVYAKHTLGTQEEYESFYYNNINSLSYLKESVLALKFFPYKIAITTSNSTFIFRNGRNEKEMQEMAKYANDKIIEAHRK